MPRQAEPSTEISSGLSGNMLKIIAAVSMVIDHVGLMFFPGNLTFRILGRLAFPIYAFMIAEGCKYTHDRRRYFGNLFALALLCQVVYALAGGSLYLSILMTFSLSILTIYVLQYCRTKPKALSVPLFAGAVICVYLLNRFFDFDYGFWGCMAPVIASLLHGTKYDRKSLNIALLGVGLAFLFLDLGGIQFFSLAAIPVLLCYSGRRGKWKMKSFFYIFYPAHLAILQLIAWLTA